MKGFEAMNGREVKKGCFATRISGNRKIAWRSAILGLACFVGVAWSGCGGNSKENSRDLSPEQDTSRVLVRTARSTIREVADKREFSGRIEPFEQNHITAGIAGRINRVLVDVGDRVRKGQLLVQMDPTQVTTLKAQLATLERDYKRLDTLHAIGSVPKQQYDQIKTQYEVTKEQLANLQRNTQLTSPIDGVITGKYYNEGEFFAMSPTPQSGGRAAIVSVMQINPVKVLLNLPESLYGKVKPGMEVTISLDAYEDREFKGKVFRLYPTVDALSHTAPLEISVPNSEGLLRPGMFARAEIPFGRVNRVLVPDLAVMQQRGTNEKFLYIVEGSIARRVAVIPGGRVGDELEIIEGLEGEEEVIISGMRQLQDGRAVRVVN